MRVRCAICDKPVDRLAIWSDPTNRARYLVAHCHGEKDEMVLTDEDLQSLGADGVRQIEQGEGFAFTQAMVTKRG